MHNVNVHCMRQLVAMERSAFVTVLCAIVFLSAAAFIPLTAAQIVGFGSGLCPGGFINFGDSLTDTGGALDAFPFLTPYENPPYGETFFGAPAKRFCNGRVLPDFVSQAFDVPLLDSYFATAAFDYKYGVNFAVGGATANASANALVPFSLFVQVNQFIRFKNSAQAVTSEPSCSNFFVDLPNKSSNYSNWLFTIEIGDNDIRNAQEASTPSSIILNVVIPQAIGNIVLSFETLYNKGARRFLIFGVPAQGCTSRSIVLFGNAPGSLDSNGCVISTNQLVIAYNNLLLTTIQGLRLLYPAANISYFDYYNATIEIVTHPTSYGITTTRVACCGSPGPGGVNYNPSIICGMAGANNCANPDDYMIWDGVHFTEAFYRVIASFVLTATFTNNLINFSAQCNLDFSKFGRSITYQQAYPLQCENLYN